MIQAAVLARVSDDKNGRSASVPEQLDAGRMTARQLGWHIRQEITDTDLSASRFATAERPGWQRLQALIDTAQLEAVILWETSRASRELIDWATFLDRCRRNRVLIHVVTHERTYNPAVARDWKSLAEDGVTNAYASEESSQRIRRAVAGHLAAGKPFGRVQPGYRRVRDEAGHAIGQEIDPVRGPVIRKLITDVADGVSVASAARTAGLSHRSALDAIRNVACIGKRKLGDGTMVDTCWPALIDEGTFWRAQAVLAEHRNAGVRPGRGVHLLSSLARCAKCGDVMVPDSRGTRKYKCRKGCCVIDADAADDTVELHVWTLLSQPGALEKYTRTTDADALAAQARSEAVILGERLEQAARSYSAGEISVTTLSAIERDLKPRIAAAQAEADKLSLHPALARLSGNGRFNYSMTTWAEMTQAARRDLVRALLTVTMHPVKDRPDGDRVEVVART